MQTKVKMNITQVYGLSIGEFKEIIKDSVGQNRSEITPKDTKERGDKYATRKQAAAALHISLPTLTDFIKRGLLPAYKIGGRILLKWDEIDAALGVIESTKFKRAQ